MHTILASFAAAIVIAAMASIPAQAAAHKGAHNSADAHFKAIYTKEWAWREQQFPDDEDQTKPIAGYLPKADPASQDMRLHYWEEVSKQLDGVRRAQLSPAEQVNYDIYRVQIATLLNDQRFRDY